MKKSVICVGIGIIIFVIGFAMMGFDITKFNTSTPYEQKQLIVSESTYAIEVEEKNTDILIEKSIDNSIYIDYCENDKNTYDIIYSDGKLNIKSFYNKLNTKWYDYINFYSPDISSKLVIKVPENSKYDIVIKNSNAKITIDYLKTKNLSLKTSNASININNIESENIYAKNLNGKIAMTNITVVNDIDCNTINSGISAEHLLCNEVKLKNKNGKIDAKNITANDIYFESINATIAFSLINYTNNMECNNKNGKIKGTIVGDISEYSIESKATNSSSNLPEKIVIGSKSLIAKTTNGKINIDFIQ